MRECGAYNFRWAIRSKEYHESVIIALRLLLLVNGTPPDKGENQSRA